MISFSANSQTGKIEIESVFDKALNMNPDEEAAFKIIYSFLPCDLLDRVFVERRSKDYISMFCGVNDFLRLKYSAKSKWLSLRLPRDVALLNFDNPLFAAQINKNQLHWRGNIKKLDDLKMYKDLICASCVYIPE